VESSDDANHAGPPSRLRPPSRAAPRPGAASGTVYRIGVLDASSPAASSGRIDALRKGLRESGLVEGQNLHIDWRFAEGKELTVANLATQLVGLQPEVLVSLGGAGAGELKSATAEIPIVMAGAHRRDVAGATTGTLAQSQENITGVISTTRALDEKRMDLLREAVPSVSRVTNFLDAVRTTTALLPTATRLNQRWTMDFIEDRLVTGRKLRIFNVMDAFSRRGLATEVDSSLPGSRIVQVLDRLVDQRGRPEEVVLDNGPEFIGRTLAQWADIHDVRLHFITPGKPIQNAHIESFHGRFATSA
jgi:Integrase core domain/ABC transporter substrate binding protein